VKHYPFYKYEECIQASCRSLKVLIPKKRGYFSNEPDTYQALDQKYDLVAV